MEIFVEKPWVIIDENQNIQKYIFKRNGELIMSLNGQVTVGRWEYLSSAKSLLIDRVQDKMLLNQNFIDPAVMILKKDNLYDDSLILANEILLPDLNVMKYLKTLYFRKYSIKTVPLKNGELLEVFHYDPDLNSYVDHKVAIDGISVIDGTYEKLNSVEKIVIEKSKISRILILHEYKTKQGNIVIEQDKAFTNIGDRVFLGNGKAPDGKYRLGFMFKIIVKEGFIVKYD